MDHLEEIKDSNHPSNENLTCSRSTVCTNAPEPNALTLLLTMIQALNQTAMQSGLSGPSFPNLGMKQPDHFNGEHPHKLRAYLQSCKIIFSNTPHNFPTNRHRVMYVSSFLGGQALQWFEPYLKLLDNTSPTCILNNWDKFKQNFFTLFGNPNEVQNAEYKLNNLVMKENSRVSVYISNFRTLQSCIQWNKAYLLFHFQKGFPAHLIKQLAVGGNKTTSLQQLIDQVIELDNGYHHKNRSQQNNH